MAVGNLHAGVEIAAKDVVGSSSIPAMDGSPDGNRVLLVRHGDMEVSAPKFCGNLLTPLRLEAVFNGLIYTGILS